MKKASEFFGTFFFGKLPIQTQHELSTARKPDASVDEIKMFMQHLFQYQQLIPQQTPTLPFNEIRSWNNRVSRGTHNTIPTNNRSKFSGDCHYYGRKDIGRDNAVARNVTMPTNNRKIIEKNSHSKRDRNTTQNWCAIQVDTPVTQHETADTERKVHLRSEMSHLTNKILTKTGKSARNSYHHTKQPH